MPPSRSAIPRLDRSAGTGSRCLDRRACIGTPEPPGSLAMSRWMPGTRRAAAAESASGSSTWAKLPPPWQWRFVGLDVPAVAVGAAVVAPVGRRSPRMGRGIQGQQHQEHGQQTAGRDHRQGRPYDADARSRPVPGISPHTPGNSRTPRHGPPRASFPAGRADRASKPPSAPTRAPRSRSGARSKPGRGGRADTPDRPPRRFADLRTTDS